MPAIMRVLFVSWIVAGAVAQGEIHTEFALDSDPVLTLPKPLLMFPTKHQELWRQALGRPEADLQRRAAEAITRAQALGFPNLDTTKPALIQIVSAEGSHPAARLAAARALIALQAKEAADTLFQAAQRYGSDLRQLVEPALAKWNFAAIRPVWKQRFVESATRHRELILAIEGLAEVGEDSAVPALLVLVHEPQRPLAVRLAAARAAGRLRDAGLEADAERLIGHAEPPLSNRLCAAALLARHRGEAALPLLKRLAGDSEPSIATAALTTLNAIDHQLVLPFAERSLASADANVREQAVIAYLALPTPERVTTLAPVLDDPHPAVRARVREAFFEFARTDQFAMQIRQLATEVLSQPGWRGQEQATLLLAALNHKPAAGRLVELLESPRPEVFVAAAWGLRKLAVPETLPAILTIATRLTDRRLKEPASPAIDAQVAHLCEAMGLMKYAPADPLLRRYIPKNYDLGELSRASAIWALGHLHAGQPQEPVAQLIFDRVAESPAAMPPEMIRVRVAGAVTLARMQARAYTQRLRAVMGSKVEVYLPSVALAWALHELTGETFPDPEPPKVSPPGGWFLEPLE